DVDSEESAKIEATNMAKKLLVNQVTENFDIEIIR
ncbi:MAG: Phosphoribosylformylglycinamidine synthase, partial [Campylobacterota bacterium]|nr:Phosphoribosylformylglycinamidine synthase [Campylobacterota bacterium]